MNNYTTKFRWQLYTGDYCTPPEGLTYWETYQLAQKSPERQNTQVFNWCPVSWTAYQLDPGEGKLMQICKWRTINISLEPRRPIWAASAHITALNGMKMVEEVTAGDDSADGHDGAGQGTVCIFPSSTYPMPAPGTTHQAAKCGVSGPRLGLSCDWWDTEISTWPHSQVRCCLVHNS